ncbi:MAG: class I SAM-dependent methyltransferase [Undibacterium sp.]|nr:class I SAM-dependent methyltransferase [Undibacterium sp.]
MGFLNNWLKSKEVQNQAPVLQLNELTNPNKWDNPEWMAVHRELESYSVDKHCFSETKEYAYRKGWEWTQCLFGLDQLGAIHANAKGLGVGAGHEPILYYLTDRIAEVVGTDLYGNAAWSGRSVGGNEADAAVLEDMSQFCPRPFVKEKLKLINMDGTKLTFADEQFDFVWSLSSIEHFGGHDAATQSMQEMARVTKKGGIVAVATELILTPNSPSHPEYFTQTEFEKHVVNGAPSLTPIQAMDYSLPGLEYLLDPIMLHLEGDVHRVRHHIVLNDSRFQWTSALCFFRKN